MPRLRLSPRPLHMTVADPILASGISQPEAETERLPVAGEAANRIARLVGGFRLIVAGGLWLVSVFTLDPPLLEPRYPALFTATALAYTCLAAVALWAAWRPGTSNWPSAQLVADIAAITLLTHTGGGISSGVGAVLVILTSAGALNLRREYALLAAAVSALAVLAEQSLAFSMGLTGVKAFVPAGMLGAIIFLATMVANPLARRLRESEALARQRGIDLANLAQLNDYVIQNLRESIVVVDDHDNIRLINQSAADLLGKRQQRPGQPLREVSPALHGILRSWRRGRFGPDSTLGFPSAGGTARINTYFAPLEQREDGPVLLFLEDADMLAEKVRQTKLAALGRLSASIAHEIRNPVGALSHAGQLLGESPDIGPDEQRLLDIINVNSRRVSEIVENVMQLSRREDTKAELIDLGRWVADFVSEVVSTLEIDHRRLRFDWGNSPLEVRMDPSHLRQICWNLCDNALQFGSQRDDSPIDISIGRLAGRQRPFLEFADRGRGIDDSVRERLFEPFATGREGGTGLGLFISRELCECNRAALMHEDRDGGGSIFRIVFADPRRWSVTQ